MATDALAVSANARPEPSAQTPAGEAPASGAIDATYTQRNGGVDLRKLDLHLPASELEAHGALGAYPVTSPSALTVDFHSHDLSEFDAVLRSLGLKRNGKTGTAALPVTLAGQADFHGSWTGSLVKPHLDGHPEGHATGHRDADGSRQLRASRSLSAWIRSKPRAAIRQPRSPSSTRSLLRGTARIALDGTLDASPPGSQRQASRRVVARNRHSTPTPSLHARLARRQRRPRRCAAVPRRE